MDYKNWGLWNNITFNTHGYRKNFDILNTNENIITEYDGTISELKIAEQKSPTIIGEYRFSVWNLSLGRQVNANISELINKYRNEDGYSELIHAISNDNINLKNINKLIIIHSLILHKNYRKHELTEEFFEAFHHDYYDENTLILGLFKPFQKNTFDSDYYLKQKVFNLDNDSAVNGLEYYSLTDFLNKNDNEFNEYKLFALANRCGFKRIDDTYLFIYNPNQILMRMREKINYGKHINSK